MKYTKKNVSKIHFKIPTANTSYLTQTQHEAMKKRHSNDATATQPSKNDRTLTIAEDAHVGLLHILREVILAYTAMPHNKTEKK